MTVQEPERYDLGYYVSTAIHIVSMFSFLTLFAMYPIYGYNDDWGLVKQYHTNEISGGADFYGRDIAPNALVLTQYRDSATSKESVSRCAAVKDSIEQENCLLASVPTYYVYRNSAAKIWPGSTIHREFLLFILAGLCAMFNIAKMPVGEACQGYSPEQVKKGSVAFKAVGYAVVLLLALWLTLFFQFQHSVSLSSTLTGFFFLFLTAYYVILDYCLTEAHRDHVRSKFLTSWGDSTTMQMHFVRSLATTPLVWLVTLSELNPMMPRHVLVLVVVLSACSVVSMLGLERKIYSKDRSAGVVKREKIVYLVAVILLTGTQFFVVAQAYGSMTIAKTPKAAPSYIRTFFLVFFWTKVVECALHMIAYMYDELQTLMAPDVKEKVEPWLDFEALRRTANARYIVFTLIDTVFIMWLMIAYLMNADKKPTLLPLMPTYY